MADQPVVHLTSLEWPPYSTNSDAPAAADDVVRAAFSAVGYVVDVTYLPWQRAVIQAKGDPAIAGYYPAYQSQERQESCHMSAVIGVSVLGLVERRDKPLDWTSLDDLAHVRIGTVQGYVNTPDFDARTKDGRLEVEAATDDSTNLRKLAAGRLRAAVIDRNVMHFLLSSDPSLRPLTPQLQFNSHMLETKTLHVCFRKDADGARMAQALADGLKKVDFNKITAHSWEALGW